MTAARVAATLLKHLVPALEKARLDLERQEADEASHRPSTHMLSAGEAGEYLRMSERKVREECLAGRLPHKKLGTNYILSERALLEWVEGGATGRPAPVRERGQASA